MRTYDEDSLNGLFTDFELTDIKYVGIYYVLYFPVKIALRAFRLLQGRYQRRNHFGSKQLCPQCGLDIPSREAHVAAVKSPCSR